METFNHEKFKHLERLCRIQCQPEEAEEIISSLSRVLAYVDQLNEVDTTHVNPCNYVLKDMVNHWMRPDEVGELLPREKFLQNAKDQVGGMIRIPPVMKSS